MDPKIKFPNKTSAPSPWLRLCFLMGIHRTRHLPLEGSATSLGPWMATWKAVTLGCYMRDEQTAISFIQVMWGSYLTVADQPTLDYTVSSVARHVQLFATPWTAEHQASLSITNSWSLLKLMSIELVMPSNHFILCRPLLLLPSIFPSIRVFSNESVLRIRWPKFSSFSFSISPSNEYSGLISYRVDWLDLLAVQGTLKSLLQHHSSKASILWCSVLFMVQLSHRYMTIGKTIALTRWTSVSIQ